MKRDKLVYLEKSSVVKVVGDVTLFENIASLNI